MWIISGDFVVVFGRCVCGACEGQGLISHNQGRRVLLPGTLTRCDHDNGCLARLAATGPNRLQLLFQRAHVDSQDQTDARSFQRTHQC